MNHKDLVMKVKYTRWIYNLYHSVGSRLLKTIGFFIKTDDNLVLFIAYGGKRYDDSPKSIYEYMTEHQEYSKYKCFWALEEPSKYPEIKNTVKVDTPAYFLIALRAKYWVTNSSASRGLSFKKKNTVYINTKHGMFGIKKVGGDINQGNSSFKIKDKEQYDFVLTQGKKEDDIVHAAWGVDYSKLLQVGLPRNDELTIRTQDEITVLRQKLGIADGKMAILYAPTFREYNIDERKETFLKPPIDFRRWKDRLGDRFVFILTAHYEVAKLFNIPENDGFIINAFGYPHINDLILASDILISDYSSIIFDYSITGKPIFSYAYDYDTYREQRGIYDGYDSIFSHGVIKDEESLLVAIDGIDYEKECNYTRTQIRDKYIANFGNATQKVCERIFLK